MLSPSSRRIRGRYGLVACGVVVGLIWAQSAWAQSTAQIPLQFDFMNPGARSLGMGGAFVGGADDASAAYANPAGLTQIMTKEFSVEGRFRSVDTTFLRGGRVSGVVTGVGADVIAGPSYGTDRDRHTSPAFLSLVMPVGHVTVAAYRHEAVGIENSFFSEGPFERATFGGVTDDNNRDLPLGGTRKMAIANYGGAIGVRLSDRLAFGGGLSLYTFHLDSDFARFSFQSNIFSPVDRNAITATAVQSGDDVSWGANAGVLWTVSPKVAVGAQFRRGPRFGFTQEDRVPINDLDLVRSGKFKVPDVLGAGVQWRASSSLRVLADYDWVRYGQLKEDFITIQSLSTGRQAQLFIDDGHEVHGGVEYLVLTLAKPLALRAGVWVDPDHAVRYEPTAANDSVDVLLSATLPGGKTLTHYTFGAGVALSNRSELNAGIDVSSRSTYLTASGVIRF